MREIRATNQEDAYLGGLFAQIDATERTVIRGELANAVVVNSAMAVLRLGLATTLLVGAQMVAAGEVPFMALFAYLLTVGRIYAPFDQCLMMVAELFASRVSASRMKAIMDEPLAEGSRDFEPADYAVVFQDVLLFDDTVAGNIRLGRRGATDEEALAAARVANCDEFAHRMRTVENADKVVVLKGGAVAEQGSPAQLMAAGGEFARMVELQRGGEGWSLWGLCDDKVRDTCSTTPSGDAMMKETPFLRIEGLRKHYGEGEARVAVLEDISLAIPQGEVVALLGPSGSGKSTFLNLLGGLERADGGTIEVDGTDVTALKDGPLGEYRRRELGFVFQFYNLVGDLTIRENIEVGSHLSRDPLPLGDLMRSLGLWEHRHKFPREVSGGQQQRSAIGRALVKNPRLLLCDEPTGALDYHTSKEILALMEEVNRTYGCTIVIVTHNDAISRMAHRVLRLRDGHLVENRVNEAPVAAAELSW